MIGFKTIINYPMIRKRDGEDVEEVRYRVNCAVSSWGVPQVGICTEKKEDEEQEEIPRVVLLQIN